MEEIVHIISKLRLHYTSYDGIDWVSKPWGVDIYDGGICLQSFYGESKEEVRKDAVAWVHDNFDVPKSIETMEEE